jgi:hypothetical protein
MITLLLLTPFTISAQTRTFTTNDIEYTFELPSPEWQAVPRLDVHRHLEFSYGEDYTAGYLRLRKNLVEPGTTPFDLFSTDEKRELKDLPGYVVCGECEGEAFAGHLRGATFSYEYSRGGKAMAGRIYYLEMNKRMFYVLHFTVAREKLQSLRGDMDFIARSFRLKW